MPTKISSYLTEAGFRQLATLAETAMYNKETGGEFIIVKENNRLYRYEASSTSPVDNSNILNTADGGDTRWITVGGSATTQTRIQYTFETESNEIPLGMSVLSKNNILYVNINNTQILSSEFTLNADKNAILLSQSFKPGVATEVVIFTGDFSYTAGAVNYNDVEDKPKINGVTLVGDKSTADLGITASTDYTDLTNKPSINGIALEGNKTTDDLGISGGALEVGDIGFSAFGIDETKNKRRYLNGQVIVQSQFTGFTSKLKTVSALYPNLVTTETNWQAEVTASKLGQCGKFVIDDTAGTIRLPKVVNINGLLDLANFGSIKAESLPNITGSLTFHGGSNPSIIQSVNGVIKGDYPSSNKYRTPYGLTENSGANSYGGFQINASSNTYQDNAPVQQEAVQYPYFIQVATGNEETVNTENELDLNNPFSLFDVKFESKSTPITNNSWLVGSNIWHDGNVYVTAYQALVVEFNDDIAKGIAVTLPNGTIYTKRGLLVAPKEAYNEGELEDYFFVDIATQTFKLPKKSRIGNTFTRYINEGVGEGHEVYSDGWCRQWGITTGTSSSLLFISLYKEYKNTDYLIYGNRAFTGNSDDIFTSTSPADYSAVSDISAVVASKQKNGFYIKADMYNKTWITEGYLEDDDPDMPEPYFYIGETVQGANLINMESTLLDIANLKANTVSKSEYLTENEIQQQIFNRIYQGRDLTVVFANEIANYSDEWAWIHARIQANNYSGLYIGDYIPVTISAGTVNGKSVAAQTLQCQIAGINTYKNCGDVIIPSHIDFISREVITQEFTWNPSDSNNATSATPYPWLASGIYAILNGISNYTTSAQGNLAHGANCNGAGILQLLPAKLSNQIITKRNLLDQRYNAGSALTYSTTWGWQDMGKLWLPNELEVYGTQIRSNLGYGQGYWNPEANVGVSYPIYVNSGFSRVKFDANGNRRSWWLSSCASRNAAYVCYVHGNGSATGNVAAHAGICCPLCFRIA